MGFSVLAIAITSLIAQIVVIALLIYSYQLKRQKKFMPHGLTMAAAVVVHAIFVFSVMIPVFFFIASAPNFLSFNVSITLGIIHGILGTIAFAAGILLVVSWRFKKNMAACFKNKMLMRWTLVLWLISLALGIILFYVLYVLAIPI
jgi:hypothetical protein